LLRALDENPRGIPPRPRRGGHPTRPARAPHDRPESATHRVSFRTPFRPKAPARAAPYRPAARANAAAATGRQRQLRASCSNASPEADAGFAALLARGWGAVDPAGAQPARSPHWCKVHSRGAPCHGWFCSLESSRLPLHFPRQQLVALGRTKALSSGWDRAVAGPTAGTGRSGPPAPRPWVAWACRPTGDGGMGACCRAGPDRQLVEQVRIIDRAAAAGDSRTRAG
jgi:hypothetical protein